MNKVNKYLIAALSIMMIFLLAACGAEEAPAPVAPVAPEPVVEEPVETVVEEVPEVPVAKPVEEEMTASGEAVEMGSQTNVELVEQYIVFNPGGATPKDKTEGESWFEGLTCQHAQLVEGEKSAEKLDKLSFKITNKGDKDYILRYVKYGDPEFENAMRIQINGRRIRDAETACGKTEIKAGETIFCANADAYLREGTTYTGKELVNSIAAQTINYNTKVVFKC